jgi:ABC-type phosphate/phosphonate transport system substrate-binding protein
MYVVFVVVAAVAAAAAAAAAATATATAATASSQLQPPFYTVGFLPQSSVACVASLYLLF